MLNKLYGIDYNKYACGGIRNSKIQKIKEDIIFFCRE